jgi:NADPH:quinone reductase-like Zn-dependent oxidoreductase
VGYLGFLRRYLKYHDQHGWEVSTDHTGMHFRSISACWLNKSFFRIVLAAAKPEYWDGFAKLAQSGMLTAQFSFVFSICLGKLRTAIDSVYAFEDVLKAYDRLLSWRATGKIIIKVNEETCAI